MKITLENFFTNFFLLHPHDEKLDKEDHRTALICSIALGILTLGVVHVAFAVIEWKAKRGGLGDIDGRIGNARDEALSTKANDRKDEAKKRPSAKYIDVLKAKSEPPTHLSPEEKNEWKALYSLVLEEINVSILENNLKAGQKIRLNLTSRDVFDHLAATTEDGIVRFSEALNSLKWAGISDSTVKYIHCRKTRSTNKTNILFHSEERTPWIYSICKDLEAKKLISNVAYDFYEFETNISYNLFITLK